MWTLPIIDPVIVTLGGHFAVRWYGLAYLMGFLWVWRDGMKRLIRNTHIPTDQYLDLLFFLFLCIIAGGRIGYVLFYQSVDLWSHPSHLLYLWRGGMSFHGALAGFVIGTTLAANRLNLPALWLFDFFAPLIPPCLGLGRIGNLINAELIGRPTQMPWGVIYPQIDSIVRHPSQIYEAFGEGFVLWYILNRCLPARYGDGVLSSIFLLCYGSMRFALEFFRQPDSQLGFVLFHAITMGQILSLPMIAIGTLLLIFPRHIHAPQRTI